MHRESICKKKKIISAKNHKQTSRVKEIPRVSNMLANNCSAADQQLISICFSLDGSDTLALGTPMEKFWQSETTYTDVHQTNKAVWLFCWFHPLVSPPPWPILCVKVTAMAKQFFNPELCLLYGAYIDYESVKILQWPIHLILPEPLFLSES